jgi:LuxR family maltose regulon positive regulatory protein
VASSRAPIIEPMATSLSDELQVFGPLVGTKVRTPADVRDQRERPRLSARLDATVDDATRLTLLSAPPGYGKTVAVAGWLKARAVPHAWLSLEGADNDMARFARYLAAALQAVRSEAGEATLSLFGPGTNPSAELVGATLLDAIAADDGPFVLVLDDVHVITAEPIHRLVLFLIEHGPPFVHPVILTREDPPLPLARLRAHGRLVELRADDLRYTAEEASTYFTEAGVGLEPDLVQRLVERTEGWIAGLQLAAVSLRDRPDAVARVEAFDGSQRFVFDYLADEVLGRIDDDLRSFLAATSIADRFEVGLCRALTGREDADALLARAEHANLFVVPLDGERHWYRYHHLLADYLRAQLDEDDRRELHERAADYLEARGLHPEAIDHALAAGSIDRAVRLVEREARLAFEAGELATLLGWLDALPPERVAASGELVSLQAWALLFAGRPAAARACAEGRLATTGASGPAEGRLLALRALLATYSGPNAEDLARASLELLDDDLFEAFALQAAGMAQWSGGELSPAVETWRLALEAATRARQPMAVFPAVTALANGLNQTGRRAEAEALCRGVLEEDGDRHGRSSPIAWWVRLPLGLLRYEANDLVEARREIEQGFMAASSFGGGLLVSWALPYLALVRQATGAPDAAREAVRAVSRATRAAGLALPAQTNEIEARLLVLQGDVVGAAHWADHATPDAPADSPLLDSLRLSQDMTIARVRLAQGRPSEARALLGPARASAKATGALAELISIRVLEASTAEVAGRRADARQALEEAIRLAAPGGYVRRFVDDGGRIAHLLPFMRKTAPAFVDDVIAALAAPTSGAGTSRSHGPWLWRDDAGELLEALTPREHDVLRLMAEGASNAEIAAGLAVSSGTARWHVGNVLAKLGVRSRTRAVVRARQLGLV